MRIFLLVAIFAWCTNCQEDKKAIKIILLKEADGQDHILKWYQNALTSLKTSLKLDTIIVDITGEEEDFEKICNAFSDGGTIMMDVTWSSNEVAKSLSVDIGIPYIKIDVSISPVLKLLDRYLDLRNSTDVSLIFDDPQNVDQSIYYWIDTTRLRMLVSENLNKATAKRLKQIRPTPNNFAIIATSKNMNKLFNLALQEDMVTRPDRWNLVFLDFEHNSFDRTMIYNKSVSLLTLDVNICCNLLGVQDPCQCPEKFNLQQEFLSSTTSMIIKSIEQVVKQRLELTSDLRCNGTTYNEQTKKLFEELLESEIENQEYACKKDSEVQVKIKGKVEIGTNESTEIIAEYRKDVMHVVEGKTVLSVRPFYRVGITHAIPWSYKEREPTTGELQWTGYCADFTQKVSEKLDFDYEFVEPKYGTFGKKVNGVWDGVIGDLASGETDLAITAIIMTADKEEVVDFVAPYFEQTGITIVMRKPVRKTSLFKFMTVLKLEVWLSIVAALSVTGFMVWFLDKYSPYSARNNSKAYSYPCREFTLKESFWFALTSFTPQGGGEAPKALSGRTLVAAYWLFVVLMLATFTANLAAFLTVERMQAPVQSLEQLAKQSRINYTVVENSDTHEYFINMKNAEDTLYRMWKELTLNASTDDTRYRVWDYPIKEQYGHILLAINDSNPVKNAEEGFRNVNEHLDADYAFIHDSSEIKYEISRNCNLTEVGEVFAEKPFAIAIQQGSHLQDDLSKTIIVLQNERFFESLHAKYWNHSSKGQCPSTDDNEGITLESLGGVFIATLFGLALAMITLVGEVFYYKRKRKNEEAKKRKGINLKQSQIFPENIVRTSPKKLNAQSYPITIGTTFKPVNLKEKLRKEREDLKLSHITLYPRARNRITQVID